MTNSAAHGVQLTSKSRVMHRQTPTSVWSPKRTWARPILDIPLRTGLYPSEVKWLTSSSLQIGDRIIQRVDTGWKLVFLPLLPGSSGDVVSICAEKHELWDHARWMRRLKDCPHGGFVFSSGWTKWGNITGPLSKALQNHAAQ